jgi:FkbM family methyltransferase
MHFFYTLVAIFIQTACYATYHSQCGQDQFVYENYFKDSPPGIFVDIGAHNGITYSNTYFLEKERHWTGLCVEPLPDIFTQLCNNRNCFCVQACVSDHTYYGQLLRVLNPIVNIEMLSGLIDKYDPRHVERIQDTLKQYGGSYELIDVSCYSLNDLLEHYNIKHINFLSLDIEGGEYDLLTAVDFERYKIDVIVVEDNYQDPRFATFLATKGYFCAKRLEWDLVFVHKDFYAAKGKKHKKFPTP